MPSDPAATVAGAKSADAPSAATLAPRAGAGDGVAGGANPGHVCFRRADSGACAAEVAGSGVRSLWAAQALCSVRSNCSGVARRPAAAGSGDTPHAHPAYDFRLCGDAPRGASAAPLPSEGGAATWVRSPCSEAEHGGLTLADAGSSGSGGLAQQLANGLHLVMTVKTSAAVHGTRVQSMLRSWGATPTARKLLFFFTDIDSGAVDAGLARLAGDGDEAVGRRHFINTQCPSGHGRGALCCKTDAELRFYLRAAAELAESGSAAPSYWCHFDDDNYVMLANLVEHLAAESAAADGAVWIGRRGPKHMKGKDIWPFTMGGAGYCLDRAAATELGRQSLAEECLAAQQPDDMTIGLVMQRQRVALRHTPRFHSQWEIYNRHLEDTVLWGTEQRHAGERVDSPMSDQITLGWDYWNKRQHDLRRDLLELHYYLLLERELRADSVGTCFSAARAGFLRGCLRCPRFSGGCPSTPEGCQADASLAEAQERCLATAGCGGVTSSAAGGGPFTCRTDSSASKSPNGEVSWLKERCHIYGEEDMPPTVR